MHYTQLGRTGARVSRLVLGTMNFGPQTEEADAHAILDAALDAGVNFIDTANVYGGAEHRGWTEEILGRWLAKSGRRRALSGSWPFTLSRRTSALSRYRRETGSPYPATPMGRP